MCTSFKTEIECDSFYNRSSVIHFVLTSTFKIFCICLLFAFETLILLIKKYFTIMDNRTTMIKKRKSPVINIVDFGIAIDFL